ncbi:hypothetical protein Pla123a_18300 [Posidoniimonas polymericola]|uniref:PEP-CTERM protein-sorting domain-containing protein n=1 Tax=Posidoniimonas polymericola TaxID=2528002 RepID=A0A5C5YTC1_9BACT|nr:hypothetical protein [Posidoniimonas polymericola]TWT78030.1 hypothetical protein Pla123a_18300 [Posidoniimonas polymericola]
MKLANPVAHRLMLAGLSVVLANAAIADRAAAAVLNAGDLAPLFGTTSAGDPRLAGTVQSDALHPFEILGNFGEVLLSGNLQDRVVESNTEGTLIFAPRLRDLVGAPFAPDMEVRAVFVDGYAGFQTEVEYRTDGLGDVGPSFGLRSFSGDGLQYLFGVDDLLAPEESYFVSTLTDATDFAPIGTARIVARNIISGEFFETTLTGINVPVRMPEPSAALIGSLVGGVAGLLVRRR